MFDNGLEVIFIQYGLVLIMQILLCVCVGNIDDGSQIYILDLIVSMMEEGFNGCMAEDIVIEIVLMGGELGVGVGWYLINFGVNVFL